jgi:hypothetical protein
MEGYFSKWQRPVMFLQETAAGHLGVYLVFFNLTV